MHKSGTGRTDTDFYHLYILSSLTSQASQLTNTMARVDHPSQVGVGEEHISRHAHPRREIKRAVCNVKSPGTFAYGRQLLAPAPQITVSNLQQGGPPGGNTIALPLCMQDVVRLREAAERAPFGHGAETKVDESVRKCWQIDGGRMGLSQEFEEAIRKEALRSAEKLGLKAKWLGVEARLYKLVM